MNMKRIKNNIASCVVAICCTVAAMAIVSCSSEEEIVQVKSEKSYTLDEGENQLVVEIPCRRAWTITGATDWCVPTTTTGMGKTSISVQVTSNDGEENRTCTMQAVSDDTRHTIKITQYGAEVITLPVVFHVLYTDPNDSLQYIDAGHFADLLSVANDCYAGVFGGENLRVKLVLATETPTGETLAMPGVEYVQREEAEMNCAEFMYDNSGKYVKLLWDPNRYINIMCYPFSSDLDNENGVVVGISHFPYTHTNNYLPGLTAISYSYLSLENLSYPYCVSLNSRYMYGEEMYYTLPHELGHYLGLFHVFSEDDDETMCIDSDYCDDTPSYNREDYLRYLSWASQNLPFESFLSEAFLREGCSGEQFRSVNAMDYNYGAQNQFTADQRTRVRHVLRHSPLLPTEHNGHIQRTTLHDGLLDLPIVTMK